MLAKIWQRPPDSCKIRPVFLQGFLERFTRDYAAQTSTLFSFVLDICALYGAATTPRTSRPVQPAVTRRTIRQAVLPLQTKGRCRRRRTTVADEDPSLQVNIWIKALGAHAHLFGKAVEHLKAQLVDFSRLNRSENRAPRLVRMRAIVEAATP